MASQHIGRVVVSLNRDYYTPGVLALIFSFEPGGEKVLSYFPKYTFRFNSTEVDMVSMWRRFVYMEIFLDDVFVYWGLGIRQAIEHASSLMC